MFIYLLKKSFFANICDVTDSKKNPFLRDFFLRDHAWNRVVDERALPRVWWLKIAGEQPNYPPGRASLGGARERQATPPRAQPRSRLKPGRCDLLGDFSLPPLPGLGWLATPATTVASRASPICEGFTWPSALFLLQPSAAPSCRASPVILNFAPAA